MSTRMTNRALMTEGVWSRIGPVGRSSLLALEGMGVLLRTYKVIAYNNRPFEWSAMLQPKDDPRNARDNGEPPYVDSGRWIPRKIYNTIRIECRFQVHVDEAWSALSGDLFVLGQVRRGRCLM